jgi:hypothetical protein
MCVLTTGMILQVNAAYNRYIKEYILFQIAQIIQLGSLTISMRLNGINLLKCVRERQK